MGALLNCVRDERLSHRSLLINFWWRHRKQNENRGIICNAIQLSMLTFNPADDLMCTFSFSLFLFLFCLLLSMCAVRKSDRIDSTMLVEEGFEVVSVDASDKMLKYALKERWNRRKEPGFDNWSRFFLLLLFFFICMQMQIPFWNADGNFLFFTNQKHTQLSKRRIG